ncbi:MAG TPA: VCBS repeat-containing protein [Planctomycetota bacterium]|nr:VCBS repeat-containing protein [Planctomycetota bacterium]
MSRFRPHRRRYPSRVHPPVSALRRGASVVLAAFGVLAAVPAQIQFAPPSCYANGTDAPFALALDDTTGTGAPLSIVAAHNFPLPPFPTGVDTWGPPAIGACPTFGPVAPMAFSGTAPAGPLTNVVDVAAAGPQGRFALVFDVTTFASYVEGWPAAPAKNFLPPLSSPTRLLAVDFDGDDAHLVDLLVLDSSGAIYLSVQAPAGTFSAFAAIPQPPLLAGHTAVKFAVGSFDNDNLPDVAVAWGSGPVPQVQILRNVGGTTLALASTTLLGIGVYPGVLTVGDFDSNGIDDFVVADGGFGGTTGAAWVCTTSRAFPWPTAISVTKTALALPLGFPTALTNGDYDGDGDLDLAFAHSDGKLHFFPNNGLGGFPNAGVDAEVTYAVLGSILDIESGDIDGDGDIDVATSDWSPGGSCCVWCNQLPAGECHHEFRGGDDTDGFVGVDCAWPRAPITAPLAVVQDFDDIGLGTFAHTFHGLPSRIRSARLTISWTPPIAGDRLILDVLIPGVTFALDYTEKASLLTLDLAHLPGGQSLLPLLNRIHYLDVAGANSSVVDFLRLDLVTSCPLPVGSLTSPKPTVEYTHTNIRTSGAVTFSMDGGAANAFGFGVFVFAGGVGCPHAPYPYDGLCLLPGYDIITLSVLDSAGQASMTAFLPLLPCLLELRSQAVAISPFFTPPFDWSKTITDYTK